MEDKLISVIVPVYNVASYLDACIHSITSQTYKNLEIIVIDDGSTDGSGSICDRWKAIDGRIIVVHQENQGLSAARNAGMEYITGEYVAFLDSDDIMHPEAYRRMAAALEKEKADVAICREVLFYTDEFQFPEYKDMCVETVEDRIQLLRHVTDAWNVPAVIVNNKLYTKELIGQKRFPIGRKMEDNYFNIDVLVNVKRAVWVEQKLYGYRQRKGSIMNSNDPQRYLDYRDAMLYVREQIHGNGLKELYPSFDSYFLRTLARKRMEARHRCRAEVDYELKKSYIRVYNETDTESFTIKEKINIYLARYCFTAYCLIHIGQNP